MDTKRPFEGLEFRPVYDASTVSRVLGLPTQCDDPPPTRSRQWTLYYGGWDLNTLMYSPRAYRVMSRDVPFPPEDVDMNWRAEPGYYEVELFPVPDTWEVQHPYIMSFGQGWEPAPIAIATTLCLLDPSIVGPGNLGENDVFRCREAAGDWQVCIIAWARKFTIGRGTPNSTRSLEVHAFGCKKC